MKFRDGMRRGIQSCQIKTVTLAVIALFVAVPTGRAATPEQIDAAVEKAVKYLYSVEKEGSWDADGEQGVNERLAEKGMHHGGLTALATYSLLATGENVQDARLARPVVFLKKLQTQSVYVLGVREQVWPYVKTPDTKKYIAQDANLLARVMKSQGHARGLYYYPGSTPQQYDHSISQFGVLGLWSAELNGAEVPSNAWEVMDKAWRLHQSKDGGWPYIVGGNGDEGKDTLSMTCAGVATLFITHDYVHAAQERGCAGNVKDENIERGLKWIGDHFNVMYEGGRDNNVLYYTLYALERIGVAGGYKYFGNTNWFANGSDFLVKHQNPDGSWGGGGDVFGMNVHNVPDTCFALLFLAHGRAPVVINKLSYTNAQGTHKSDWNERPRDISNLTRWVGRQLEAPLNWHIVSLSAPLEELHDAPILYLSGSEPVELNDADLAKIKQYVEAGGMILANANCGHAPFVEGFQKLGSKMFPKYEFREIPATHPLYTNQQFAKSKMKANVKLMGLSNGVRELMLMIPEADLSRVWQVPFQGNIDPFAVGADIVEYSTDRQNLQERKPSHIVAADPGVAVTRTVKLARLQYSGNWDPEPGGWRRLSALLRNKHKVGLTVEAVTPGEGKLKDYKLAHLTGTTTFKFNDAQREEIKKFVAGGGTLLIDAAGGSADFADSAEEQLTSLFGAEATAALKQPLLLESPVYQLPDAKIESVTYRIFARSRLVGKLRVPRVYGVEQKGRIVAFYSREDLSAGLVGEPVDGIAGYDPDSATAIVRNIVLNALPKMVPTTLPTKKP